MNAFATSPLPTVQNVRHAPSTNVAPKMSAPHADADGDAAARAPVSTRCRRDERVDEHDRRLRDAADAPQREVGRHHLEQRAGRSQQHDVELPGADVEMDHVDVADEHVGDRDADAAEPVEERDLLQRPTIEHLEVREQHEHDDEVDERQEERARSC